MMPRIVFFGDNVSRTLVSFLHEKVKQADSVLVLGSSLQVSEANSTSDQFNCYAAVYHAPKLFHRCRPSSAHCSLYWFIMLGTTRHVSSELARHVNR